MNSCVQYLNMLSVPGGVVNDCEGPRVRIILPAVTRGPRSGVPIFLAIIAARAGSKGVPGKNLRPLGGKPLVAWSVGAALKARAITHVVVSSDSPQILKAAALSPRVWCLRRPAALSGDRTAIMDVYRHVVVEFERAEGRKVDYVVGLQPPTPFRLVSDIDACVKKAVSQDADVVITVRAATENPYFLQVEARGGDPRWFARVKTSRAVRRQDAPPVFVVNGAVYVWKRKALFDARQLFDSKRLGILEMPEARSLDFDTEDDFLFAEFLLAKGAVSLGG